ncbi:hypothetical protein VXQ18_01450 [Brucella abortus]|nr:hypothetical protein [Brucella abortus]
MRGVANGIERIGGLTHLRVEPGHFGNAARIAIRNRARTHRSATIMPAMPSMAVTAMAVPNRPASW